MISKQKIFELMDNIATCGLNNPIADDYFDEIVDELGNDVSEILKFLESLDDDRLYYISSVFPDLCVKFEDKEPTFCRKLPEMEERATKAVTEAYQRTQGGKG